ncbi:hypothetical protein CVT24_001782 [Panaeolus cyanescens]|uniref:Uncharacterized protein n=1 Tax=Panaeolus cyanescens TaxID=181874 RepID=A0A409YFP2_9AGAR|nr:hypothetical protein CVT24_001782 [Panaeolus cyanescens]
MAVLYKQGCRVFVGKRPCVQATHQPVFHEERKIAELPVAFEQRNDWFSALDKFVIRHQALKRNAASSGKVNVLTVQKLKARTGNLPPQRPTPSTSILRLSKIKASFTLLRRHRSFPLFAHRTEGYVATFWELRTRHPEEGFVYAYSFGNEMDLQWELSGLNVLQKLNIWITATEGRDGGAAQGVTRALRREYVSWTVRLVIFPAKYDDNERQSIIENFPAERRRSVRFTSQMTSKSCLATCSLLSSRPPCPVDEGAISTLPPHHISVRPLSSVPNAGL